MSTAAARTRQPLGWPRRAPAPPEPATRLRGAAVREEALGYVAMVAFLLAYALMVAELAPFLQGMLNLTGSGTGIWYLARKQALPNVISNAIWAVITLVGLASG